MVRGVRAERQRRAVRGARGGRGAVAVGGARGGRGAGANGGARGGQGPGADAVARGGGVGVQGVRGAARGVPAGRVGGQEDAEAGQGGGQIGRVADGLFEHPRQQRQLRPRARDHHQAEPVDIPGADVRGRGYRRPQVPRNHDRAPLDQPVNFPIVLEHVDPGQANPVGIAQRRRMLEIEIEDARARLQLAEQQRELLEVESETEEAMEVDPPRLQEPVFDQQSLMQTMSRAFADALNDSAARSSNGSLINRLASQKDLLTFSGDSLEWLRFKRAFQHSTRLGNYTDSENVSRLYSCLTGKARECVDSLMITTESAEEIMSALELEYGSKDVILRKLVERIRKLPSLDSGDTNIITFASTVRNNVAAMGSLGERGYFNNPDFQNEILKKIPSAMVYRYNDYVATGERVPDLQTLAEFLGREAERANRAGTARLAGPSRRENNRSDRRSSSRHVHAAVPREKNSRSRSPSVIKSANCRFCNKGGHKVTACNGFSSLSVSARWRWAKKEGVCFKCLDGAHMRDSCIAESCKVSNCQRPHHKLLHAERNDESGRSKGQQPRSVNAAGGKPNSS